jgi:AcrR family transcriptional regulator
MAKKEDILEAAQQLFGRQGYSGTTVKDVAELAGVSFGLVPHYYGSKESLFFAAGFDMVERILRHVHRAASETATGLDGVTTFVREYFEFTLRHHERFLILIRCSPFSDLEEGVDRNRIAAKFAELVDEIGTHIERGVADGSIRPQPVREAALIVYATIVGAVRTRLLTPYDTTDLYGRTVEFIERSIAARPV